MTCDACGVDHYNSECAECGNLGVRGHAGVVVVTYADEKRTGQPIDRAFLCSVGHRDACAPKYMRRTAELGVRRVVLCAIPAAQS